MISVSIDLNCASKMKKMGKTRNIISQQPKSLNEIETVKSERVKKEKLKSHSKIDEREEGTTFDILFPDHYGVGQCRKNFNCLIT
ncbi:MAG: hypothetical protein P8Y70_19775 [Candidatus Lokiarchaeota archaeon]